MATNKQIKVLAREIVAVYASYHFTDWDQAAKDAVEALEEGEDWFFTQPQVDEAKALAEPTAKSMQAVYQKL